MLEQKQQTADEIQDPMHASLALQPPIHPSAPRDWVVQQGQ